MKVKICGITNLEDAFAAVEYGADALGFIFAPESPRYIPVETAEEIISRLPPFVSTVGVVTDASIKEISDIIEICGVDRIQFHGAFSSAIIRPFSRRAIQVIRVKDEASIDISLAVPVRAILLDTYKKGLAGGSGICFNWDLALAAKKLGPIILAGGLNCDNVQEAICKVSPYGLDASSGIESRKGKKDLPKMKQFIRLAKEMPHAASQ